MYHSFIHSPSKGHLVCYQFLVFMNKATIFTCKFLCEHTSSHQLGKYLGVRLLDHMVRLFCKKLPNCILKWLYRCAFLSAMNESSCHPRASLAIGIVYFGDFSHSDRCAVISHCFNFYFYTDKWYWTSSHMHTFHLSLVRHLFRRFCLFLNWVVCFLTIEF